MSAMENVPWTRALARRLRRQHLADPSSDVLATASRLTGLHAQVASATELMAAVRTPSYRLGGLDHALWTDGSMVKTWGMRGTLHLFPASEFPLLASAFRQRQWPKFTPAWERYHGVTPDDLRAITAAVGEVLPGRTLTREELAGEIAAALDRPELAEAIRSGWGQMLKPAAAGGLLCFGPDRGRNVTFTDPRSQLPHAPWADAPDTDAAIAVVIGRFLDTYGPATHEDFGRWWGIDAASARRLFAQHAEVMVEIELDGRRAWTTPAVLDQLAAEDDARGVWLLPGFDPYVLAPISHRAHTVPEGCLDRVSRTAGWISPVLVVDGVIRGVWSHELKGDHLRIVVEPFAPVDSATTKGAVRHAQRYAELFDAEAEVAWQET